MFAKQYRGAISPHSMLNDGELCFLEKQHAICCQTKFFFEKNVTSFDRYWRLLIGWGFLLLHKRCCSLSTFWTAITMLQRFLIQTAFDVGRNKLKLQALLCAAIHLAEQRNSIWSSFEISDGKWMTKNAYDVPFLKRVCLLMLSALSFRFPARTFLDILVQRTLDLDLVRVQNNAISLSNALLMNRDFLTKRLNYDTVALSVILLCAIKSKMSMSVLEKILMFESNGSGGNEKRKAVLQTTKVCYESIDCILSKEKKCSGVQDFLKSEYECKSCLPSRSNLYTVLRNLEQ